MQTIYKYKLEILNEQSVDLPKGSQILACMMQRDVPHLWVQVDMESPSCRRMISMRDTGQRLHGEEGKYIGTIMTDSGAYVQHVFDGGEQ